MHCIECGRLAKQQVDAPAPVEIGRGSHATPPMPSPVYLDLERGITVLGADARPHELARYMSKNGYVAPVEIEENATLDLVDAPSRRRCGVTARPRGLDGISPIADSTFRPLLLAGSTPLVCRA